MVQEIFLLEVKLGTEQEFEQAFQQVSAIMSAAKGCLGSELHRCLEQRNQYFVIVRWQTVEDHVTEFKNSTAFQKMKSLIGPYYLHIPQSAHFEKI